MEDIIFYMVLILLAIIIFIVKGLFQGKRKREQMMRNMKIEYGQFPKVQNETVLRNAENYFIKLSDEKKKDAVDDITWNDLDLDLVYNRMNYTRSSAGAEMLYRTLRTPAASESLLEQREKVILEVMENEDERVNLLGVLQEIGTTGKYSFSEYLEYLQKLKKRSNLKHILIDLLYIPAVLLLMYSFGVGILAVFVVLTVNILTYFKEKGELNPYLVSFGYILRMSNGAKKICALDLNILKRENEILQRDLSKLKKFEQFSGIAMSMNNPMGSSNPFDILFDYLKMMLHLDLMKFNQMLSVVLEEHDVIEEMVDTIGTLDAMISIAYYRASLEYYCVPVLHENLSMKAEEVYHPLLSKPVANSISTDSSILLTGSNASGKSTFLKTMAISAIMAQTIHTVLAKSYEASCFDIVTSMSLRDNITGGESYFIVEIKALKRILNKIETSDRKVLCFVDEVLRGTNTVERIAASSTILKSLADGNVICFAATHDIELTYILDAEFKNYHFEEHISDGDISFNYQLQDGRATSRNAIKLLEVMGYDKNVVQKATNLAEYFMETGKWEMK